MAPVAAQVSVAEAEVTEVTTDPVGVLQAELPEVMKAKEEE